jgi:hypothetical protein
MPNSGSGVNLDEVPKEDSIGTNRRRGGDYATGTQKLDCAEVVWIHLSCSLLTYA